MNHDSHVQRKDCGRITADVCWNRIEMMSLHGEDHYRAE